MPAKNLTAKYVPTYDKRYSPNFLFLANEIKNYRFLVMVGGTRSTKTYSFLQFAWREMDNCNGAKITMARQTLPALKATVLADFIEIGLDAGTYSESSHNKSDKEYRHNGNLLNYFSAEDDEKVRGNKTNLLYLNEGPEMEWNVVKQLIWRTEDRIIMDYNPSYPESWAYSKILSRDDCAFITTTYKDNPFLTPGQIAEMEWMRENAPEDYVVYGLGQRGEIKGQIWKHWKYIKALPEEYPSTWAIDWGFATSQLCICEFKKHLRTIFGKTRFHGLKQDNLQCGIHLFFMGVKRNDDIIADDSEPKSIAELRRGFKVTEGEAVKRSRELGYDPTGVEKELVEALADGWLVQPVSGLKGVETGIKQVRSNEVFWTEDSVHAWQEYRLYRYPEDKATGETIYIPPKTKFHNCDLLRYYSMHTISQ